MTAEEFWHSILVQSSLDQYGQYSNWDIEYAMIEFAKYHCNQQVQEILNNIELVTDKDVTTEGLVVKVTVDTKSITNAYPLEQIK